LSRKLSLELPPGVDPSHPRYSEVLNEKLRAISSALGEPVKLLEDLDAAGHKIVNLGDATAGTDALSRAVADKRYLTQANANAGGGSTGTTTTTITASGKRQLILSVPGTLGIGSSLAPLISLDEARTASGLVALVKRAPTGASLRIQVMLAGVLWAAIPIANGAVSATLTGAGLGALPANTLITLDVVGVGTTFPGGDLSVLIRFA